MTSIIDKQKKMTLTQFKIVLERFMLARQKYLQTHSSAQHSEMLIWNLLLHTTDIWLRKENEHYCMDETAVCIAAS